MSHRTPTIIAATLLVTGLVVGGLLCWARFSATRALDRTLRAVAHGRPVPSNVDLRLVGMEVALDDEPKLRTVLRTGYEIAGPRYDWQGLPRRSFGYSVELKVDIDMVCEVYFDDQWVIACGQIKCMVSPCRIHLGSNGIGWLDSSPPNTSLERARDR